MVHNKQTRKWGVRVVAIGSYLLFMGMVSSSTLHAQVAAPTAVFLDAWVDYGAENSFFSHPDSLDLVFAVHDSLIMPKATRIVQASAVVDTLVVDSVSITLTALSGGDTLLHHVFPITDGYQTEPSLSTMRESSTCVFTLGHHEAVGAFRLELFVYSAGAASVPAIRTYTP